MRVRMRETNTILRGDRAGTGFRFGRVEIVTCLWIVSTLGTVATATAAPSQYQHNPFYTQGRYGKREDPYPLAGFFSGSRYGRAETTNSDSSKADSKMVQVSPRVDRFFLGSRYGKRAVNTVNNNLQDSRQSSPENVFLKRFKEALGYCINRVERADRILPMANRHPDRNTRDKFSDPNHPDNEDMSFEFFNQDKLDNIW